ncbi:HAMP domain-containing sensor histidine kinase [Geothrix sp.]|uniref:two-component system sensor histidine kinase NtrB n=1 Tax=Geothrix sp. TaxID=1962974 RepID=UPI0025BCDDBA|nr:HAMP domain-containing sensor histidine kinase [Geothrix sp.]
MRAPLSASWRSHRGVLICLILLLAGNAVLPMINTTHPVARVLDYLVAYALAFVAAGLAWARARREGPTAFGLLGLGAALGGLHYLPTQLHLPQAALAGPAISILGLLALGAGFLCWPQQIRMKRDRARTVLDGVAIALSMFTAAWLAMGSMDWVGRLPQRVMLMYALQISASLGVLALWLLQEIRLMLPEQSQAKGYVRAALIALLCHGSISALLRVTGHYQGYTAHGSEVLHQAANFLLALAALSPSSPAKTEAAKRAPSTLQALIPSAVSLAVLLLAAFQILRPHAEPQRALLGLGVALLSVLMLRHGLLILDLERLSQDLEGRVEERTRKLEAHHHEAMGDLRMRMMAGLAAGLAHDLNNILGIIRLRVDLLEETSTPPQRENLAVLRETTERAATMTRRILASGRAQDIAPTAFDFTDWMESRGALFQALLRPDQTQNLQVARDLHVFADPQSLDQVFQNLVTNARDAMGPTGNLCIRAQAGPGSVLVEVRDDGPGIPPEHLARMFEPFFTTKAKGTGLGLATVRNLVIQNRGSIRIESQVGQGTAFLLELPAPERLLLA